MLDGKMLFDAYRSDEAPFARALDDRSDALSRREQRMILVRIALVLGVFMAVFFLAVRQHGALRDSIVGPVAALLRHIGRVRDGQLEATVAPGGARDLRQLGEGLNEMVRALAAAQDSAASRDEMLREHSVRLRQILEASREFSESLSLAYVVGSVLESTAAVGGYERIIVWLMDDSEKRLVNAQESSMEASADATVDVGHGLAGRAAKAGRITFEGPTGQVRFADTVGLIRAIAIPLIVGARVVGALEARHAEARVVTTQSIEVLEMLATHAATAIESARLHELTEEGSQIDALTHLSNRRRLDSDLDAECKRCVRYARPLSFVMLDVDHFKPSTTRMATPQGTRLCKSWPTSSRAACAPPIRRSGTEERSFAFSCARRPAPTRSASRTVSASASRRASGRARRRASRRPSALPSSTPLPRCRARSSRRRTRRCTKRSTRDAIA
jgi:hypothetical protein